jgi:hypothetical protein
VATAARSFLKARRLTQSEHLRLKDTENFESWLKVQGRGTKTHLSSRELISQCSLPPRHSLRTDNSDLGIAGGSLAITALTSDLLRDRGMTRHLILGLTYELSSIPGGSRGTDISLCTWPGRESSQCLLLSSDGKAVHTVKFV